MGVDNTGGDGLTTKGFVSLLGDFFTPKASDIFENRTATRIFDDHQGVALESIRGGSTPTFNENQNLYGFTIFQFKKGFLGGWEAANVSSLLGPNLLNALTGGDQLANTSSYFFNVHPSSISLSEPFATQITPTQGGGMYVESQGVVLSAMSISGTTGYRPGLTRHSPDNKENVFNHETNEPTGYLNFLKLRNLFRNYSDLKKNAGQAYKVYLVWYNGKEQESWFFEPSDFSTLRDSSSPFTYRYEIKGTLIQKINFSSVSSILDPRFSSMHFYMAMLHKTEAVLGRSPWVNALMATTLGTDNDVTIGGLIDGFMNLGNMIASTKNQILNVMQGVGATAGALVIPVIATVTAAQNIVLSGKKMKDSFEAMFDVTSEEAEDLKNVFTVELFGIEALARRVLWDSLTALDLIKDQAGTSDDILLKNKQHYGSKSALHGTGGDYDIRPIVLPDTEKSLKEILLEATGDISSLDWVIEFNKLKYPYISKAGSSKASYSSIKTPGDIIFFPFPAKPVSPNIFTKPSYKKVISDPYAEMLGRDMKLSKTTSVNGVTAFELGVSPSGDIDLIEGSDNMGQAIDLKLNTNRGELPLHTGYGLTPVIGRKGNRNLKFELNLALNDTLLSDGRIEDLSNVQIQISGDIISTRLRANIIGSLPYIPVSAVFQG